MAAVTAGSEPKSFVEAMKDSMWRDAMKKEMQALEDNETWTLEPLTPGKRAIGCRWVYKIKYNEMGQLNTTRHVWLSLGISRLRGLTIMKRLL